jgi:hypothetical protein
VSISSVGELPLDVVYLLDVNADLLLQTQHVPQRERNTSRCLFISAASVIPHREPKLDSHGCSQRGMSVLKHSSK